MRDHVHLILTPAPLTSLEKAMQFVKGGFSFRAKKELNFNREVWEKGFNEHRIKDADDYAKHIEYIWMNPVRAGYVDRPEDYLYSSARCKNEVDPAPTQFLVSFVAKQNEGPWLKPPKIRNLFPRGLKASLPRINAGGSHPGGMDKCVPFPESIPKHFAAARRESQIAHPLKTAKGAAPGFCPLFFNTH